MNEQAIADKYKRYRSPPEIISYSVWLYFRFALSDRDVAELLAARGVVLTDETVRRWCRKCGQQYANARRRRRPRPGDTWHLDAVFVSINGVTPARWRAVDQDGTIRDILVHSRRDKAAARKSFRRLRKDRAYVPRVIVTDTRELRGGQAGGAAARRAPAAPATEQPGRACPPADPRAGAAHAAVQAPGPCAPFPRGLRPARRPLPPTPPPLDRYRLSPTTSRCLHHLARGHRRGHCRLIHKLIQATSARRRSPHHAAPSS